MKKYTIIAKLSILISLLSIFACFGTHVRSATSYHNFESLLGSTPLAVVMFYKNGREEKKDKKLCRAIEKVENIFEALGNWGRYRDAEVTFIKVNCVRPELEKRAHEYEIDHYPSFITFDAHSVTVDAQGKRVALTGFVTRTALKDFIETNLGHHIIDTLKQKETLVKERKEEAKSAWVPYYYPYDYYYPYWDFYGREPSYTPGVGSGYHYHSRKHYQKK